MAALSVRGAVRPRPKRAAEPRAAVAPHAMAAAVPHPPQLGDEAAAAPAKAEPLVAVHLAVAAAPRREAAAVFGRGRNRARSGGHPRTEAPAFVV
mmetsp:Transcript_127070/g.317427  ORF Transcript_127070/g.317427 Transcript_127070/m.317427 type:complete len:95 (+) Transcript_127070:2325-2609(+)